MIKRQIPNFLTLANLLTGTSGIIFLFTKPEWSPAWFVWLACGFDFLDGFAARALKVTSPIGKELDSLADVVSFGVFPSLFMMKLLENSGAGYSAWIALLLAAAAAWRLAKFNTDSRQTMGFLGLPTPAHALFITGLPYLLSVTNMESLNLYIGIGAVLTMAWLMVSELPLPALKFKSINWTENKFTFSLLLISLALIFLFKEAGIPLSILVYIIFSFFIPDTRKA